MGSTSRRRPAPSSWWLAEEIVCVFCWQHHPDGSALRCNACDRALCVHCAVVLRKVENHCPDCCSDVDETDLDEDGEA